MFYADCMIDINDYLAAFPGVKASGNIGEAELDKISLNSSSITNVWIKHAYV